MGNFCTQCGRPLQEGEVCNCTQQNAEQQAAPQPTPQPAQQAAPQPAPAPQPAQQAAPQPAPAAYQQAPQQPMPPSQTAMEVKNGFNNLVTALKTIWTNPANAASALAHKDSWLPALILIVAQALFSGLFALTNFSVGMGADDLQFLVIAFFFTFFSSLALAAAAMGMYLAMGKATKAEVTFKSALATTSIRCFVCIPLTFIGMFLGMANVGIGLFFFILGEIIAILLTILAVQETYKLNANRAFVVVGSTYVVIFVLFFIAVAIYCGINLSSMFGYSSLYHSSWY